MEQQPSLADVLSEFARTILTDFSIQSILEHLVVRIVEVLPITSAGVTLITPGVAPHLVAASDEAALQYERLQSEVGEGPCTVAYRTGMAVSVPDLADEARFEEFGRRAQELGLVAVFTFPLRHLEHCLGALDLYREAPGALDPETMGVAQTLADVAAAYLLNAQSRVLLRESADRYRASSLHDPLTGLPNRVLVRERLQHATVAAQRTHTSLAVLFVDLDGFKQVNDERGHQTGDNLLIAAGHRLNSIVRAGDTVARMSGDEFVVVCEDIGGTGQAELLGRRIVNALAAPFVLGSTRIKVSASVGIAYGGRADLVPDQLLDDADEAMYQAKRAGGGRHRLIDLRDRTSSSSRVNLEHDLHGATTRGELRNDYQPIVRSTDGRIEGIEALLRWDHPGGGVIPPDVTIPIAEHSGLIVDIGLWALQQACTDRSRLQRAWTASDLQMSVNVSTRQLRAPEFVASVRNVLAESNTRPDLLTLEVTESVYIDDIERALVVLDDLHQLGVRIALDDFGTGYSSLVYLQRFPIDVIKIDRGFIAAVGGTADGDTIARSIVGLAHGLGMTAVAEGVETTEQHARLVELGCDACQGFYFDRPMSAERLEHQLQMG